VTSKDEARTWIAMNRSDLFQILLDLNQFSPFQFIPTLAEGDCFPFDPDHESYLSQVRFFNVDQEIMRVNMIPSLLGQESAGPDDPAQKALVPQLPKQNSILCFVMISLIEFSSV
jgi:hypothetical protein